MSFRIFGTPQGIEGSADTLDDALDAEGLEKKKKEELKNQMSPREMGMANDLDELVQHVKEENRG